MIDDFAWERLSNQRREALIDHELQHLALSMIRPRKANGFASGLRRDDLGRPALKIRPHDWALTGFRGVVERHGEASIEALQFADFRSEFGQLNLFGPDVLGIVSNAKNGNAMDALADSVRKVLKPGKGIEKVTMTVNGPNGKTVSVSSDDLKDISKVCARRHHKDCRYDKCECDCHIGATASAEA